MTIIGKKVVKVRRVHQFQKMKYRSYFEFSKNLHAENLSSLTIALQKVHFTQWNWYVGEVGKKARYQCRRKHFAFARLLFTSCWAAEAPVNVRTRTCCLSFFVPFSLVPFYLYNYFYLHFPPPLIFPHLIKYSFLYFPVSETYPFLLLFYDSFFVS